MNEIKKTIYLEQPKATLLYIRKGSAYYETNLQGSKIHFSIPIIDMGDADFLPEMEAKYLIRWLVPLTEY